MNTFPFGLDKEAQIYCSSSKIALQSDPKASYITNGMAAEPQFKQLVSMPFDVQVNMITRWTRESVEQQNDLSENSVAWMIALFSKSYEIAGGSRSFDDIFTSVFKNYYRTY